MSLLAYIMLTFLTQQKKFFGNTTILFNPPYGERLNIDVEEFYKKNRGYTKT